MEDYRPTGGKIYQAINAVMKDIGAVGKDSYNEMQCFRFRGIDAVMNALHPALCKHGVFTVPEILEQRREERQSTRGGNLIYSICTIRYTFYADDGSHVSAVTIGEGMDSGDKATNKAMAIALKYALFQVFCVPTEEMTDPDAESPEAAPKAPKADKADKADKLAAERAEVEGLCKQLGWAPEKVFVAWPQLTKEQLAEGKAALTARLKQREERNKAQ